MNRFGVSLILAAVALAAARHVPPPMFSREYVDALQGITGIETADAQVLERQLQADPTAWTKRLRLLAYAMRADQLSLPQSRELRKRSVLWLIEHQPESEILTSPFGALEPGILAPDEAQHAARLWDLAIAA